MSAFYQRVMPEIVPPKHMKLAYFDYQRREGVFVLWPFNYIVELAWLLNCWWCHYTRRQSWIDRLVWDKAKQEVTRRDAQVAARDAYIDDIRDDRKRVYAVAMEALRQRDEGTKKLETEQDKSRELYAMLGHIVDWSPELPYYMKDEYKTLFRNALAAARELLSKCSAKEGK